MSAETKTTKPTKPTIDVSPAWKKIIQSKTDSNKLSHLSVATVDADNLPVNELLVYHGFAGEDNNGETGWQSDLITATCDKRTLKMVDHSNYAATWVLDDHQFRIRGKLHMLGHGMTVEDIRHHIVRKKLSKVIKEDMESNSSDEEDVDLSDKLSAATKSFLKRIKSQFHRHGKRAVFDWEAERLRQWHELPDNVRAQYTWDVAPGEPKQQQEEELPRIESLEIGDTDAEGWFKNDDQDKQQALERGYENFVVLFLEVTEIDSYSISDNQRTLYRKDGNTWVNIPVHA
ncbi:hypothetical protein O0I10_001185 [Lichtheimia ornata]|uniref:Pyridoxamine 5'-phosphate oxidase Alr4036 family FMN-binding domain-containing protein n=1 Tax=Lichtheimia ornata TaxID=688661 RepID=A0AAD7Y3A4_9FUNG|nr:uncharacterized protein O0I10_001185 [Lichtheimia ornata]KAJ8663008.1 hypothetical protein O0I10_001185 [Lichtheimia ornata]